jgi:hypothetical protein
MIIGVLQTLEHVPLVVTPTFSQCNSLFPYVFRDL